MFSRLFLAALMVCACSGVAYGQAPRTKGASVPPAEIPHKFTAKVVQVLDGDTIRVANSEISVVAIRLEGIDAPEHAQEFGPDAQKYLHDLVSQKEVTVEWKERDKYRRLLGYIYLDGKLVNRALVEDGWAWQYTKYNQSPALKQIETTARTKKLGLWATENAPIAPWDWRDGVRPEPKLAKADPPPKHDEVALAPSIQPVPNLGISPPSSDTAKAEKNDPTVYITDTGTKYHSAGCRHLKNSAISMPLSRASSAYSPCQHCSPPR